MARTQRVTLNLDLDLEAEARRGGEDQTATIHAGLRALVRERARHSLMQRHGTLPDLDIPGRRRWDPEIGEDVVE